MACGAAATLSLYGVTPTSRPSTNTLSPGVGETIVSGTFPAAAAAGVPVAFVNSCAMTVPSSSARAANPMATFLTNENRRTAGALVQKADADAANDSEWVIDELRPISTTLVSSMAGSLIAACAAIATVCAAGSGAIRTVPLGSATGCTGGTALSG